MRDMAAILFGDDVSIQESLSRYETVGRVGRREQSNSRDSSREDYGDGHFAAPIHAHSSYEPADEDEGSKFGQGIRD